MTNKEEIIGRLALSVQNYKRADAAAAAKEALDAGIDPLEAINDGLQVDMEQAIVIEEKLFGSCFQSADQIEGMSAFLEKRKHEPYQNK